MMQSHRIIGLAIPTLRQ